MWRSTMNRQGAVMTETVDHYVTHAPITLSFIVPAYNVAEYVGRCISSLLSSQAPDVEIIVVNDGSTDETGLIADEYALANPGLLKVIHQSNRGHGGAINTGMAHAGGAYIKVIDADDWVDPSSLITVLTTLREQLRQSSAVDLVVTNYVYEKQNKHFKHVVRYDNVMPTGRTLSWDDIGTFRTNQYLIMHSLIFKASVLRPTTCSMWISFSHISRCPTPRHCFTSTRISTATSQADRANRWKPKPWCRGSANSCW